MGTADDKSRLNEDEHKLLERVVNKDKLAFEQLYKRYYHRLFQFAQRMLRDRPTVEEVVDDTMFTVWNNADKFEGRSSVSTWVHGIAYRRTLKALERRRRYSPEEMNPDAVNAKADTRPESDPASAALTDELQQQLKAGINKLSSDHRAVMLLTIMGHSYIEIAEIVDCPANTVKTRMFHARQHLKDQLSKLACETLTNPTQRQLWHHNTPIS